MKFFAGQNVTDSYPRPLPYIAFGDFVNHWLRTPVICPITAADYAAMDDKAKRAAKNTSYFTASCLKAPHRRHLSCFDYAHLLVLDVDDNESAAALLNAPLDDLLPWNFALWTTLTSRPDALRLRLIVETEPLTEQQYRTGVDWLAARLSVAVLDSHSRDPVHLWYRPTTFCDRQNDIPLIRSRTAGPPLTLEEWQDDVVSKDVPRGTRSEGARVTNSKSSVERAPDVSLDIAEEMLQHLDPDASYWAWVRPLMGLKHQFGEDGYVLFDDWSSRGKKYPGPEQTQKQWDAFKGDPPGRAPVTIRTLVHMARAQGWTPTVVDTLALETAIKDATTLGQLTGPVLRKIHAASLLTPLEVEGLLGRLQARSKALKAPLTLKAIKDAFAALDARPEVITSVPEALQGFVYVREPALWVHPIKGVKMTTASFNVGFIPDVPEDAGQVSTYALRVLQLPTVDREGYDPKQPSMIFTDRDGASILNSYRQSHPEADPMRASEAGEILQRHLQLLIPDPHARDVFLSWVTWCLNNPGDKAKWHVFLQGAPGCGKSALVDAIGACFGPTNYRKVTNDMVSEKFNAWAEGRLMIYFDEVLLGERQRDTMEKLKDLVTGEIVNIRAMRTDAVERPNRWNAIFTSNHLHGLRLDRSDRRFFCLCCAQQCREDVLKIPREHFEQVIRLQRDLAGGLRHYLLNRPTWSQFSPHSHAPDTFWRNMVIQAGASEIDTAVVAAIEQSDDSLIGPTLLSASALLVQVRSDVRHASGKGIARVLGDLGYVRMGQREINGRGRHTMWYQPDKCKNPQKELDGLINS